MKLFKRIKLENSISKNKNKLDIFKQKKKILPIVKEVEEICSYLSKESEGLQEQDFTLWQIQNIKKSDYLFEKIEKIVNLINPIIRYFSEKELKDLDCFSAIKYFGSYKTLLEIFVNTLKNKQKSIKNNYKQLTKTRLLKSNELKALLIKKEEEKTVNKLIRKDFLEKEKTKYTNIKNELNELKDWIINNKNEEFRIKTELNNKITALKQEIDTIVKKLTEEISNIEKEQKKW
ncbi:hypothetical protein [Spiroplasma endosymbiont of Nebria brevicollis]|uniref:hypothetical protein n=1 Tax=Spiroplasma endosymbiont of Nebria brevicollis TaxID=3066284 RepID=UPI00313A86A9